MFVVENFIKFLKKKKINFFTGVPDSVLKNFSTCIEKNKEHIICNRCLKDKNKKFSNFPIILMEFHDL